jgi:ribonucleoside-diphosphate reductase alpha chain
MSSVSTGDRNGNGPSPDLPPLTDNARKVLQARYLKKNERGVCIEEPEALFRRVAKTIADVELLYGATEGERQQWEEQFYRLVAGGTFMPNSPTLMNAGREMGMLSACFVLPVRDSVAAIFDSIKHTALIQKAGGGTGFAFDELRPTGDFIRSSGGTTSGPISFWRAFSEATNAIQQGAFRRGANMGMMYIHHPDILKFLHAKQDLNQFTNYNISVKITDAWMTEFLDRPDSPHVVRNPRSGTAYVIPRDVDVREYELRDLVEVDCVEPVRSDSPERYFRSPRLTDRLPAELRGRVYTKREMWEIIVRNAWQTGEPGVVFIDRINEHNPTPQLGRIEATNPCGEQPLLPYEACNLGSVNLGRFVTKACTPEANVDWDALRQAVHLSTRFLDNVIDANNYPLPEIERMCKANRKIGLGIMGFADALYKLCVPYNSEGGLAWGERFMQFVNDAAHNYSEHLARCRGCFENWSGSVWHTRRNRMMRNATVTTVAPTGTISIIANCTGGIEPMFSLAFMRNVLRDQAQGEQPLIEVNETFRQDAEARGIYSQELIERVAREGTLAHIEGVPEHIKRVFVCAHDVSPEWHIQMQAAFQRHCDSSISKTINFPASATPQDVEDIYRLAFELGCKGVTVYRDGCRSYQPMALKKDSRRAGEKGEPVEEYCAGSLPPGVSELGRSASRGSSEEKSIDVRSAEREADEAPDDPPSSSPPGGAGDCMGAYRPVHGAQIEDGEERSGEAATRPRSTSSRRLSPPPLEPRDLPEIVSGLRIRQMTPFGNMHVKITVDPRSERELEVFAQLGKGGDVANSDLEAICRMISLWLRAGGSLRHVIKQLEGIGSSLQIPTRAGRIMSLGDGLAGALKLYLRAKERFGLRALLLGEIDLGDLRNPYRPPHTPETAPVDRSVQAGPESPPRVPPANDDPDGDDGNGRDRTERLSDASTRSGDRQVDMSGLAEARGQAMRKSSSGGIQALRTKSASSQNVGGEVVATFETVTALADPEEERMRLCPDEVEVRVDALVLEPMVRQRDNGVHRDNGQVTAAADTPLPAPRHFHDAAAHYHVKCPECGSTLARQEGCRKCHHCGWAAC